MNMLKRLFEMERLLMKLKKGLTLREVAGQYVIVPTGKAVREIRGMFYMNKVGAYLWNCMGEAEFQKEDLTAELRQRFPNVDADRIESDVEAFLKEVRNRNLLEGEPGGGYAYIRVPVRAHEKRK